MDETPAPRETPDLDIPLRDLAALDARWRWIKGPWGFSVPQLFGLLLDADGHQLPTIVNVKDEPDDPPIDIDDKLVHSLVETLAMVLEQEAPGGSVALMWARPGPGPSRASDRAVLCRLHAALQAAPFRAWPLWFATDDVAGIVPPDELVA